MVETEAVVAVRTRRHEEELQALGFQFPDQTKIHRSATLKGQRLIRRLKLHPPERYYAALAFGSTFKLLKCTL